MTLPPVIPTHVSIIMDGNGRWAKQRGLPRVKGHAEGVESVRAVLEASVEWGVKYISLFAFSEENWARPQEEVDTLMSIFIRSLHGEVNTMIKNGVRCRVLGNLDRLNAEVQSAVRQIEEETVSCSATTLIIFVSYSGRWDIRQAAARMAADGGTDIEPYLVTAGIPDPDVLIRTSGEQRISNFMLWQLSYTELVFSPVLWPDFRKEEYLAALTEFASRDRRFGKVK